MASALAGVATPIRGLRSLATSAPALTTSGLSLPRIKPASVLSITFLTRAANLPASPFLSCTAIISGRSIRPTRSYCSFMNWSSFLSTSASAMAVFTSPAMRVGLKKVFSWRNMTVSPPMVLTPSFMPILIGADGRRRGRGQLLPHLFRDVGAFFQLRLAAGQGHGKGQTGGEAAFLAVGFGEKFEDFNSR